MNSADWDLDGLFFDHSGIKKDSSDGYGIVCGHSSVM